METPLRILVVEDDADIARGTNRAFEKAGYVSSVVVTGAEALQAIRDTPPDIVLLDRQLPDQDGLEICRQIKSNPATADICVVIASGASVSTEDQLAGLEGGADGYIVRPIPTRELVARMDAFARIVGLRKKLEEEVSRREVLEAELDERVKLRTAELMAANRKLDESRRAALNLMRDATAAKQSLALVNDKLVNENTERARLEEELLRSERLFRLGFDSAPIGRCMTGLDGVIFRVNQAMCDILGYTPDELVGKRFLEITHPDDKEKSSEGVQRLMQGLIECLELQKRYVTKSGAIVWGIVQVSPVKDAAAAMAYFSVYIQDVTVRRQMEAALIASEALLNSAQRLSKIGGWQWDIGTQVMSWTEETYRIHDLSPDVCNGPTAELMRTSASCYPEEHRRVVLAAFQRCVDFGETYDLECPFNTPAGRQLWVRTNAEAVLENGKIVRVVGNIMDITDRHKVELALRESEARLSLAQQAAGAGTWDWDIATGKITWSSELFRLFGLDPAVSAASFDTWLAIIHPDDRDAAEQKIATALRDREPLDSDYRVLLQPGDVRWINAVGDATYDQEGKPVRMAGICLDITRRKRAEDEAKANHQRMLSILDANPDPVYVCDPTTREILYANRALIDEFGPHAGRKCHEYLQSRSEPCSFCTNDQIFGVNFGKTCTTERQNEANKRWYRCAARAITWPDGRVARYEIAADITEGKKAEVALLESLQEKESLLKEIHHRVKNNLQVISSLLRIQSCKVENDSARAALMDTQNRVRSMALVHEHLYRSENLAQVDLAAYLKQLCQQLFRALAPPSATIQLHLDLVPVRLGIDQAIPCGLLANELVSNAIKHAFPNDRAGEVRVELQRLSEEASLRLCVSDNGVGLPAGFDIKHLTSLGLQLTSDLTRQLGGRLNIRSGPGTTFEVVFSPERSG